MINESVDKILAEYHHGIILRENMSPTMNFLFLNVKNYQYNCITAVYMYSYCYINTHNTGIYVHIYSNVIYR